MLTQQEKDFIRYWAANRLRRKKVVTQFLIGIPIGLAFVIPIVINFVSGWYKRAQIEANSQDFNPVVLLVALLLIVGFTAIFYQRHQWDQFEQRYRELLAREARENSPVPEDSQTPPPPAPNSSDTAPSQDLQQKAGKN
jgi:formate hydrogenlyase subunit 3/multisubunit Na+/H+ antiporter MnhD subunit